jgi:nitrogen fixation protein
MPDIIDINISPVIETVDLTIQPNLTTINVNTITGGGGAVTSVNTLVGDVVLNQDNILDGTTNKQYSLTEKNKLAGIAAGAEVNVNADWNAVSGDAQILNKPTIPDATSDLTNDSGFITIGDVPTPSLQEVTDNGNETTTSIKAYQLVTQTNGSTKSMTLSSTNVNTERNAEWQDKEYIGIADISDIIPQVNSDWNATSGVEEILNKPTIPDVSTLVPYTGATTNVNLGEFELKAGQLTLDTTPTGTAAVATTRWNDTLGSSETTLKGGSVILKNGVDLVARIVNKVTPNTTLTKAAYQVVRISGAQGQRLAVNLAQANNDLNSADTLGIVTETIATNQEGFILTVGQLENINTTGSLQGETWTDGDVLYLSPTTAGRITNIKPNGSTGHIVVIGYVEYAHANNGKIYVKIMNGWELDELHNVFIDTPLNNQALTYETSTDLWKNKTIIEDSITNGVTAIAPSQNAVFDALALKQNALSYTPYKFIQTSQTAHTGTTAETIIATATITGGTFNSSDVMKVIWQLIRPSVGVGAATFRLKINTSNTLTGATLIAQNTLTTVLFQGTGIRTFTLQGGNLIGFPTQNSFTDFGINAFSPVNTTYNTANVLYVFFTLQLATSSDSVTLTLANITN